MTKFTLICEDNELIWGPFKTKHEFDSDNLTNILGHMTKFLQKTSYLDNNKQLTFERTIDLDAYTETLFNNQHACETVTVNGADVIALTGALYPYTGELNKE